MDVDFDKRALEKMLKFGEDYSTDLKALESHLKGELGFADEPVPYDEETMLKALEHPAVKRVRVFKQPDKKKARNKRKAQRKARRKGR